MEAQAIKKLEGLLKKSSADQQTGVKAAIEEAFAKKSLVAIEKIVQYGISLSLYKIVLSSQQLTGTHKVLIEEIAGKVKDLDNKEVMSLVPKLLDMMASKTLANEQNEYQIRKELSKAYSDAEDYPLAARALADMHLDQMREYHIRKIY